MKKISTSFDLNQHLSSNFVNVFTACNTCSSLLGRNLTVDDNQSSQLQRNTQEDQAKNRHNVEVLKMSTYLIIHMSLKFHSVQRSQATLDLGKKGKKQKQPSSQGIFSYSISRFFRLM